LRLDDGQADGDELAEELEDLLRGHHVLLPDRAVLANLEALCETMNWALVA